jgi:hypothetical protein
MRVHPSTRALAVAASVAAAVLLCFRPAAAVAQESSGTKFWLGVRAGGAFFANKDPNDLEDLSTALSAPTPGQRTEFRDKGWEVPFGARLGLEFQDKLRVYALYERLPYLLERDTSSPVTLTNPTTESIRLDAPANIFGGGFDLELTDAVYGQSLVVGFAAGHLSMEGRDQDVTYQSNYVIDGTGRYLEVSLAAEYEFNSEVKFLPFIALRLAKATTTRYQLARRLTGQTTPGEFEIDYTGITIGLEGRFQLWPWGSTDDGPRDLPAGGRWED